MYKMNKISIKKNSGVLNIWDQNKQANIKNGMNISKVGCLIAFLLLLFINSMGIQLTYGHMAKKTGFVVPFSLEVDARGAVGLSLVVRVVMGWVAASGRFGAEQVTARFFTWRTGSHGAYWSIAACHWTGMVGCVNGSAGCSYGRRCATDATTGRWRIRAAAW